jgi:hypothetical protein
LTAVGVYAEEGLGDFGGFLLLEVFAAAHLSFAVAADPVGVECQEPSGEMTAGPSDLAQGDLQRL